MKVIRKVRRTCGMTQKQLAEALGVTQGAVSQWETGRGGPSAKMLKPLADVLGVTVDDLLEAGEDETSNH